MPTIINVSTAQDVDANGQVITPSRILAKLELHLPPNTELDHNTILDLRNQLLNIAGAYTLGPGEVMQ